MALNSPAAAAIRQTRSMYSPGHKERSKFSTHAGTVKFPSGLLATALRSFALAVLVVHSSVYGGEELEHSFANPPDSARPWVWGHWLNGNVSKESITTQLQAIRRVGLSGVTMFDVSQAGIPPGPHGYFDPGWQELFAFEIAEAKRLGLEVMSANGAGYSGNGGPWITPELASQKNCRERHPRPGRTTFFRQAAAAGG